MRGSSTSIGQRLARGPSPWICLIGCTSDQIAAFENVKGLISRHDILLNKLPTEDVRRFQASAAVIS